MPDSPKAAASHLRSALASGPAKLPRSTFVRAWCSIAYLYPGLHPDGFEQAESGWPRALRPFAAEAWCRAAADRLSEDELYPSDAAWAGLYDRMLTHLLEEKEHRLELASRYGRP